MESGKEPSPSKAIVPRRDVLNWTWKALAAGLVVEAGWMSYDILVPRPSGGFGGTVEAGAEVGFPAGEVRYFPEGRFYVTRVEDEIIALYQKCPHLGCRVPFCDSSGRFECPCHGSIFNLKGEYVAGPSPRGMDQFPVSVSEGLVAVDTGTIVEGPAPGVLTMSGDPAGPSCLEGTGAHMDEGGMGGGPPDEHMEETPAPDHAEETPAGEHMEEAPADEHMGDEGGAP